jgi:RNase P subunit RPR2
MNRIKSISSKQVIRIDPEIQINWECPKCKKKHKEIYRMPLLQKDMGFTEVTCKKCNEIMEVEFRPDGSIYL